MNRQTGLIITIVVAILTLCCSLTCCLGGLSMLIGGGDWYGGGVESYYGFGLCCPGVLVWLIPLAAWFFLVRGKSDEVVEEYTPPAPEPAGQEAEAGYETTRLDDEE